MRAIMLGGSALALTLSVPALAQDDDPYARCAALGDRDARLDCFDTTYAAQISARAEAEARAAEQAARAEEQREEEFGLNAFQRRDLAVEDAVDSGEDRAAAEERLSQRDDDDDITITSAVIEVFQDGRRRQVILLENGQMWRETSNSRMRRAARAGWVATVSESMMGGFRMVFEGQTGFLGVTRVR